MALKSSTMASPLPHILLIVTDQFRHDAFSFQFTPNLYNLSTMSTVFDNAYASTPTCTPSRSALLTGKSSWNHGMLGYASFVDCEKYRTTLPMVLDGIGYDTVEVGKNHFGTRSNGSDDDAREFITHGYSNVTLYEGLSEIPDDYDQYFESLHPGVDPLATCNLGWNDWKACPYAFAEMDHPTSWTTREALRAIDSHEFDDPTGGPLMLKVSYHRPHSPYDPPKRLFDKHMSRKHRPEYGRNVDSTSWDQRYLNKTEMSHDAWHGDPGDDEARTSRAAYLANVELVDEGIGQILDSLGDRGVLEEFFIIWTSDHGDMNGDHYLWRKGYPYEASSHINMMMKLPHQKEGTVSQALVENRDIAPTIYEICKVLDRTKNLDPLMDGISLLPLLNQSSRISGVRNRLDLEHNQVYDADIHWNAIVGYLNGKLYKYIFFATDGREQLFCITDDPDERHDMAAQTGGGRSYHSSSLLALWRKALIRQFQNENRGAEWVTSNGTLVIGRRPMTFGPNYPCPLSSLSNGLPLLFSRAKNIFRAS